MEGNALVAKAETTCVAQQGVFPASSLASGDDLV
jgi:hypothetical protein